MKIDQEDFKRKAQHILETVVKPQVERYERAKAIEQAKAMEKEQSYSYDELRTIAYNAYCLGQLDEPTENKYNLWIQQFKQK